MIGSEPTSDQITAMKVRVVDNGLAPWADFAVFTPYHRRFLKLLKYTSFHMQPDGSFKHVEMSGPASFDAWYASWQVFTNTLLMITTSNGGGGKGVPVVTPSALSEYLENFRELTKEYPEAWHLCVQAEDKCRAEHLDRLRRARERDFQAGLAPSFNPRMPWNDIFRMAARDKTYWDKNVRDPAVSFMARGGARRQQPAVATDTNLGIDRAQPQEGKGRGRKRGRGNNNKDDERRDSTPAQRNDDKANHEHPKRDKAGKFTTTREGKAICFAFGNGKCKDVCVKGMQHVCQLCLGSHSFKDCKKNKGEHKK